jgi:hypothetical protein
MPPEYDCPIAVENPYEVCGGFRLTRGELGILARYWGIERINVDIWSRRWRDGRRYARYAGRRYEEIVRILGDEDAAKITMQLEAIKRYSLGDKLWQIFTGGNERDWQRVCEWDEEQLLQVQERVFSGEELAGTAGKPSEGQGTDVGPATIPSKVVRRCVGDLHLDPSDFADFEPIRSYPWDAEVDRPDEECDGLQTVGQDLAVLAWRYLHEAASYASSHFVTGTLNARDARRVDYVRRRVWLRIAENLGWEASRFIAEEVNGCQRDSMLGARLWAVFMSHDEDTWAEVRRMYSTQVAGKLDVGQSPIRIRRIYPVEGLRQAIPD